MPMDYSARLDESGLWIIITNSDGKKGQEIWIQRHMWKAVISMVTQAIVKRGVLAQAENVVAAALDAGGD